MTEPFRVFSGFDSRQAEAAEVFAYSVHANASLSVEVVRLKLADLPVKRTATTEFTYLRWLVPWWGDYEGRAAYFDGCDMLCLGDVAELAALDMEDHAVMVVKHPPIRRVPRSQRARSWSSVMLMDCAKLGWLTPGYVETAPDQTLMEFGMLSDAEIGDLPSAWNVLCGFESTFVDVTRDGSEHVPADVERRVLPGPRQSVEPANAKLLHWSYLSHPGGGSWIDRSGSTLWAEWRTRWRDEAGS